MIASLKPYESMNTVEVMTYWTRVRYKHSLSLYESPNHVLWALVDEAKAMTLQMRDTNTGQVYEKEEPERVEACPVCGLPPDLCVCAELKKDMIRRRYAVMAKPSENLPRGKCSTCPDKQEVPKEGYPWTCKLRGFGVGPEYPGCTRELGLKKGASP